MKKYLTILLSLIYLCLSERTIAQTNIEAVDLGLSIKWANCNLGATTPEEYGDTYSWADNKCKEGEFLGNISGLSEYDPAKRILKRQWKMPNKAEVYELITECKWSYVEIKDVKGYKVIGKNSNSIFIPLDTTTNNNQYYFLFWSSTQENDVDDEYEKSYCITLNRDDDYSIKELAEENNPTIAKAKNHALMHIRPVCMDFVKAVDLGLSVKWASCDLGAKADEDIGDVYMWGYTEPSSSYEKFLDDKKHGQYIDYATNVEYRRYPWTTGEKEYKYKKEKSAIYDDNGYKTAKAETEWINLGEDISNTTYDAAKMMWGANWRMPTAKEWIELVKKCKWEIVEKNGVHGYKVTGPNGNSIFFAHTQYYSQYYYWTSTISNETRHESSDKYSCAQIQGFTGYVNDPKERIAPRYYSLLIRPVKDK